MITYPIGVAMTYAPTTAHKVQTKLVADTRLSSGHLASGVRGHSGLESMYSMNWVTYSFMWVRHVSMQGMLRGGGGAIRSYCTRYAMV